jgi:hypothetical protein
MAKKIYRRLLLAAIALLMTLSLAYTGPVRRAAAVEQTCDECIADCDAWYQSCVAAGRTGCSLGLRRCYQSCSPVCNVR